MGLCYLVYAVGGSCLAVGTKLDPFSERVEWLRGALRPALMHRLLVLQKRCWLRASDSLMASITARARAVLAQSGPSFP